MGIWPGGLWLIGLLGCPAVVQAQSVPAGYQQVASEFGLPSGLLYAVALTESGQSARSGGQFRPWPWTLNINGTGRYFASRQQAWQALDRAVAEPGNSVDIGLMQVNWRYHRAALASTWGALEPYHNLRVAAAILRHCHRKHEHWLLSAGCYHAPHNAARAHAYAQRVKHHWPEVADGSQEAERERP